MVVQALSAREKGLLANFKRFHSIMEEEAGTPWTDELVEDVKSDGAYERYHFFGAPPRVHRWAQGTTASFEGFDEFVHQINNEDYQVGVEWYENDDMDNRSPTSIDERTKETARRFQQMRRRMVVELITASYSLIGSNPLAQDGFALFSSSHTHRSGGNSFGITGLNTTEEVEADIWRFINGLREVTDTAGENLIPDEFLTNENVNLMLLVPYAYEKLFYNTINRELDGRNGFLVAVSNTLPKRFRKARIIPLNLFSGATWRIFLTGMSDRKPIIRQSRLEPRPRIFNRENDAFCALNKMERVMWDSREGWGIKDHRFCGSFS